MNQKKIISVIVIIALIGISGYFILAQKFQPAIQSSAPATPQSSTNQPVSTLQNEAEVWKTYRNEELSFQFSYPARWGERVNPSILGRNGEYDPETGLFLIIQNIFFPSNDFSVVADPRKSCLEGDDYRMTIGQGHVFKDGEYFSRWCNDTVLIQRSGNVPQSSGFRIVNTVNTKAIMWVDNCPFSGCDDKIMKGSVNLQDDRFPGVGFAIVWAPKVVFNKEQGAVDVPVSLEELLAEFESVLKTIELIK